MNNALVTRQEFRWSIRKKGKHVINICSRFVAFHALAFAVFAGTSTLAYANPTGGTVAAGSATISSSSSEVDINQTSNRAVINWGSFDINSGETTRFVQPGSSSLTLNRVTTSGQISTINGNLFANGHVIIINPNGVLIGPHGNVDVAGFVASSADIADSAFMNGAGAMQFNKAGNANAVVENQGNITIENAGLGLLVAPTVKNSGVIEGNLARLQMGAGDTFGVDFYGDGLLNLAVGTTGAKRSLNATNTGKIIASGGKVLMTAAAASDVVDSVINTSGVVQATSLVSKGGQIVLTGAGTHVNVAGTVDASGKTGGGDIKIGGDLHGADTIAQAATVDIDSGAVVVANATDNGNGGSIAVWGSDSAAILGKLEAEGGANGGDGGFVETSSQGALDVNSATVDTTAAAGNIGGWLLDPALIKVWETGDSHIGVHFGETDLDVATINNASSTIFLNATDEIDINADVKMTTAGAGLFATVTGIFGTNINVLNQTISTNGGQIAFSAQSGTIKINNSLFKSHGGNMSFDAENFSSDGGRFGTAGGDFSVDAWSFASLQHTDVNTTGVATDTDTGSVSVASFFDGNVTKDQLGTGNTYASGAHGGTIRIYGGSFGSHNNNNCFKAGGASASCTDATTGVPDPVAIIFSADHQTKVYGASDPTLTYTESGAIASGDSITGALSRTIGESVGNRNINQNTLGVAENGATTYVVSYVGNTLTITPATLIITAKDESKTYGSAFTFDGSKAAGEFSVSGLKFSDSVSGVSLSSSGAAATATVANDPYTITAGGATGTGLGNYTISYVTGLLTVNKANLTITAADRHKTYGNSIGLGTADFTTSGLKNSDTVTGVTLSSTGADASASVGHYAISGGAATGTGLSNYNITYANGDLHVKPAALTITALDQGKTYGDTLALGTTAFSASGLKNSDTVTGVTLSSVGAGATANVGNYTIADSAATGTGLSNYNITYASGNLTVSPAALTITATDQGKTYGDTLNLGSTAFTTSGLKNSDTVTGVLLSSTGTAATASVGDYAIADSAAVGTGLSNYNITYTSGNLHVSPASLTVMADSFTKVYGNAFSFTGTEFTTSGLKNGDTVTGAVLSSDGSATTANVAGSPYAINVSGAQGSGLSNYNITYANGQMTVTPATLTVTAAPEVKTYGTNDPTLGYDASGLVNGDSLSGSLSRAFYGTVGGEQVGTYAITLGSLTGGSNYNIQYGGNALTINAAQLNIIANLQSKTYGANDPELGYTQTGLVNGTVDGVDISDSLTGSLSRSQYGTLAGEQVGTYDIGQGTLAANGNYTTSFQGATLTINPAALSIVANDESKTYGTYDPELGYTQSGLVNGTVDGVIIGDSLTGSLARGQYGTLAGEQVGTYDIGQGTLAANSNYTTSFTGATLTINPASLSIVANDESKTYGTNDPELGYTQTGLVNGTVDGVVINDSLTGSLSRSQYGTLGGEQVGSYDIGQGSLAANGNYTTSFKGATFTINPASLSIVASDESKTYGTNDPELGYTQTGLVNGTVDGVVINDSLTGSLSRSQYGTLGGEQVGSYDIGQGSLAANGNYTTSFTGATLTINPASLSIVANDESKTYGTNDPTLGYSAEGLVNGTVDGVDINDSLTGSLARDLHGTLQGEQVGSYAITQGTLAANSNYQTPVFTGGTLTISQAALNITANDESKTYGTNDPELGYSETGLVNGTVDGVDINDSLTGSLARSQYGTLAGEQTGTYAITQGSMAANGNYALNFTAGTLTIDRAVLNIAADAQTKVYGTNDPGLSYSQSGLLNDVTVDGVTLSDALTGSLSRDLYGTWQGEQHGTYGINQGTLDAGANYKIVYAGNTLTISRAKLVITADDQTKTEGTTFTFDGTEFTQKGLVENAIVDGVYLDDVVTHVDLSSTGAPATALPGDYPITASGATDVYQGNEEGGNEFRPLVAINEGGSLNSNYCITYVDGTMHVNAVQQPGFSTGEPGRPVLSVADNVIDSDPSFKPFETQSLNTDVSLKLPDGGQGSAGSYANLEPAAGDDGHHHKKHHHHHVIGQTAEALSTVEPAAGGTSGSGGTSGNNDVACANDFLDNKACAQ